MRGPCSRQRDGKRIAIKAISHRIARSLSATPYRHWVPRRRAAHRLRLVCVTGVSRWPADKESKPACLQDAGTPSSTPPPDLEARNWVDPQEAGPPLSQTPEVGPTLGRGENLGVDRTLCEFAARNGRTTNRGLGAEAARENRWLRPRTSVGATDRSLRAANIACEPERKLKININ
jgi:hypothetical protein